MSRKKRRAQTARETYAREAEAAYQQFVAAGNGGIAAEDMPRYVDETPPGQLVMMTSLNGKSIVHRIPFEKVQEKMQKYSQNLVHFVCIMDRPGATEAFQAVETILFPPSTPDNDLYIYCIFRWPTSAPMLWTLITVPDSALIPITAILAQHGLRPRRGLVPVALSNSGQETMPFYGDRVYVIEALAIPQPRKENDGSDLSREGPTGPDAGNHRGAEDPSADLRAGTTEAGGE